MQTTIGEVIVTVFKQCFTCRYTKLAAYDLDQLVQPKDGHGITQEQLRKMLRKLSGEMDDEAANLVVEHGQIALGGIELQDSTP